MKIPQPSTNVNSPFRNDDVSGWEKRSKIFGSSLRGVLFQRLPDAFNEHIHKWQLNQILLEIKSKSEGINILDVGCGYGRISIPLLEKFPGANITGIDISQNFVELYKKSTGQNAFVGHAENLNVQLNYYDYVICVTVLMYIEQEKIEKTILNFLGSLKKGGIILLIEPLQSGAYFQTCFGLFNLLSRLKQTTVSNTGGKSFKYNFLKEVIRKSGGIILREYRLPATSLLFLPLYLLTKFFSKKNSLLFNSISRLNDLLKFIKLPSIYIFQVIEKQ
jgi:2-polyprenyl-3-methyl-5-hydroxy-6-metoxy-1,4-benzoquinol methylase